MASILLFVILSFLSLTRAQDRAPHGLVNENPVAFSPSAFEFFNPYNQRPVTKDPCDGSSCSPLPLAATVQSNLSHKSRSSAEKGGRRVGSGAIAGIVFGFAFAVLLAMAVYYVAITRRANMSRTTSVQPDV